MEYSKIFRIVSALTTIFLGFVILILWVIAANDGGEKTDSVNAKQCRGCYNFYHNNIPSYWDNLSDPYPLLVAFGVICGVFWWITGFIGICATTRGCAKVYAGMGIVTYVTFVIIFTIIESHTQSYVQPICQIPTLNSIQYNPVGCSTVNNWWLIHQMDSITQF